MTWNRIGSPWVEILGAATAAIKRLLGVGVGEPDTSRTGVGERVDVSVGFSRITIEPLTPATGVGVRVGVAVGVFVRVTVTVGVGVLVTEAVGVAV